MEAEEDITRMLHAATAGGEAERNDLLEQVYGHLRAIARKRLSTERDGHTLQPTDLIHESFVKMLPQLENRHWEHRGQFYFAAAEAMRRILTDHARRRNAVKRTLPDPSKVSCLTDLVEADDPATVLAIDEALAALEAENAEMAQVVRLRFFGGLSVEETAEILELSSRTTLRRWQYARAWLYEFLTRT